ncbi:Verru_Chthon cassette protein C [Prosthecobacter sp.]|uniref:Verru_Chthon cassette protein C n=1 Tax=Prosthecobacter sp. TaxID=1965333 RepID=UPI0037852DB6
MKHHFRMVNTAGASRAGSRRLQKGAFTLVELLVSITFLVILMLVVTQVVGIVQRTWVRANSRVSQFREARKAFDLLSQNLSQATLNTYWTNDLQQLSSDALGQAIKAPTAYKRQSELHFICGPTTQILSGATGTNYPGHAVFFQAPLGVVRTDTKGTVNTANLSNLLCGRGYFVEWGSDQYYRPTFLGQAPYTTIVPVRNRLRLMEWSPTAEMNDIYSSAFRDNPNNIRQWYQDQATGALAGEVSSGDDTSVAAGRYFTRPIAENILALIISPQTENTNTASGVVSSNVYDIAKNYLYDSALVGTANTANTSAQGTQHLMPPMLKVTMVALDERSGELLSSADNAATQSKVMQGMSSLFTSASNYTADLEGTPDSPGTLKTLLLGAKLNYRVFTTTIALRQARFSY